VGTISHSNQLSDHLRNVPLQNEVVRPLKMIQDVVTRWWSTYQMIQRFLSLAIYLDILAGRGLIQQSEMLTTAEMDELKQLERILQPFMAAQQALEGEKYVSNSLMPHVLKMIRSKLFDVETNTEDDGVKGMVQKLLRDQTNGFNTYWGSGENGTVFHENETLGYRQRQKGIPKKTLMACFLDPRTKDMSSLENIDSEDVLEFVRGEMLKIAKENEAVPEAIIDLQEDEENDDDDGADFYGGLFVNLRNPNQRRVVPVHSDVV
jgi:hypothetical protein